MVTIVTGSIIAQPSITFLKYGLLLRKGEIPKEAPKKTKETWKDHLSTFLSFLLTVMIIVGFLLILYYKWTVGRKYLLSATIEHCNTYIIEIVLFIYVLRGGV